MATCPGPRGRVVMGNGNGSLFWQLPTPHLHSHQEELNRKERKEHKEADGLTTKLASQARHKMDAPRLVVRSANCGHEIHETFLPMQVIAGEAHPGKARERAGRCSAWRARGCVADGFGPEPPELAAQRLLPALPARRRTREVIFPGPLPAMTGKYCITRNRFRGRSPPRIQRAICEPCLKAQSKLGSVHSQDPFQA
jgi:hypothetical protein